MTNSHDNKIQYAVSSQLVKEEEAAGATEMASEGLEEIDDKQADFENFLVSRSLNFSILMTSKL